MAQWGKLFGDLHDHKKTRRARTGGDRPRDASAMGLWVLALSWCIDNWRTDGWVPASELDRWDTEGDELAGRLVDAGLWHPADRDGEPGYQFHEWTDYQKPAEKIKADREKNRVRVAQARSGGKPARKAPATKPTKAAATPPPDTSDFDAFWDKYPRKDGKAAAAKAYKAARKHADHDTVIRGLGWAVKMWRDESRERQFIPHASTWLNQGRWEDETPLIPGAGGAKLENPQARRATLAQCENREPHERHQWESGPNLYHCPGVE